MDRGLLGDPMAADDPPKRRRTEMDETTSNSIAELVEKLKPLEEAPEVPAPVKMPAEASRTPVGARKAVSPSARSAANSPRSGATAAISERDALRLYFELEKALRHNRELRDENERYRAVLTKIMDHGLLNAPEPVEPELSPVDELCAAAHRVCKAAEGDMRKSPYWLPNARDEARIDPRDRLTEDERARKWLQIRQLAVELQQLGPRLEREERRSLRELENETARGIQSATETFYLHRSQPGPDQKFSVVR